MNRVRIIWALLAIVVVIGLQTLFISQYATLEYLKDSYSDLKNAYQSQQVLFWFLYFILYTLVSASPFPAVAVLTIAAGAIFGVWKGIVLVSIANLIGGVTVFILCRYYFEELIGMRYQEKLQSIKSFITDDDFLCLISLRWIPGVPFFVMNVALAMSSVSLKAFGLSTQIGMLLILSIFVNAGSRLSSIDSFDDIMSIEIVLSLGAISLLPLMFKFYSVIRKT